MFYSFQLWRHPNVYYREAVHRLSRCELLCMLSSIHVETNIQEECIGSAVFLTFESRPLSPEELSWLRGHSCVIFMAEKRGKALIPLPVMPAPFLPEELPEVLKYKGKTSPALSEMMLNTALSLSEYAHSDSPLTVLDPLCGRGTGLFCALLTGANAVGLDQDRRDLKEAGNYFSRFLKLHRLKHTLSVRSETVDRQSVPARVFQFSPTKEQFQQGDIRSLSLYEGDTTLTANLLKKDPAHILIADLPYGVQHAPQSGQRPESFQSMLRRALPAWRQAIRPGGAIALSFNTLTLKKEKVQELVSDSGFLVCSSSAFTDLAHPVEQAIIRDLVFAIIPSHPQLEGGPSQ